MSDDEDYMSATFSNVTEDVRPGLVKSNVLKRKYDLEKKAEESRKQNRTKPIRQLEEEHRNAGLDAALSSDNKGFAILQKMGYKPGMKLGSQRSERGLHEPIRVEVKAGRGGLGREEELKQKIKEKEERKSQIKVWKEHETEKLTEEFRRRMRDKVVQQKLKSDVIKLRKVCEKLDFESNVKTPMRTWFWFTEENYDENEEEEDQEDKEQEELELEDQLYFINDYLRGKYFYCVWCCTKYNDETDMQSNCPGSEKDDHDE